MCATCFSGTINVHHRPENPCILDEVVEKTTFTSLTSPNMRKIEKQMCDAVQSNKDWQSANTSVHFDPETGVSIVRLHGNKIAEVSDNDMTIFDGGYQSTTTKQT